MKKTRDLKLRSCLDSFKGFDEMPVLKTKSLRNVGATFDRNMRRVNSLILFPPAMVYIAITVQRHVDRIEHRMPKVDRKTIGRLTEVEMRKELERTGRVLEQGGAKAKQLIDMQQNAAFGILSQIQPEFYDGPEAWMASQIIATWTAFEAMTEDLWEAALNAKPLILARLSGRGKSAPKSGDDGKRILLNWLQKYRYNLSRRMGTVFLEENRYAFDTLTSIREAYTDAFSEDFDAIETIMSDKSLDALSLVRNNLVHNGGIIDHKYLKRAADLPPEALGKQGSPIRMDGELVVKLIGPVMRHGHNLVIAVDDWLAAH
jgi:hypothetical protein